MARRDREIEMLNDTKPMMFIGDTILRVIGACIVGAVAGFIGWLALVGLDKFMNFMGI